MATTGALPTIPVGIGADKDASQEYLEALNKVQKALENRNQINLFNVAGQFFNPGRTGQFSEALGNASTALGKDISEQQAAEPNIAMMRAQLAGQKYTMSNDAKAAGLIAQTLGVDPAEASRAVSSGSLSADQMNKLAKIYPTIAQLSPTRGELVKNMFTMNKDLTEMGIKERQVALPEAEFSVKYDPNYTIKPKPTAPVTPTTPVSSAGDQYRFENLSASERDRLTAESAKIGLINDVTNRADVSDLFNKMPYESRRSAFIEAGINQNKPPPDQKPMTGNTQVASTQVSGRRPDETIVGYQERKKAESQAQIDISKKSVESREATPQKKFDMIAGYDASTVQTTDANLDKLYSLVNTDSGKKVMSLLNKQGLIPALAQGAESGITTPIGSLSAPALEILQKLKLKPEEQNLARMIAQSISDLNMNVMKQGKDIFGPQISVYDAQKMAEPGFKTTDSAVVISSLVNKFKIMNHFQGEMNKAQQDYFDRNPSAVTSQFFKSKEFKEVADQYSKTLRKLNELSVF
jgi:hypothetical protein